MPDDKKKNGGSLSLFALALGASLAATGAAYYASHKDEIDQMTKKKVDEMVKFFNESKATVEKKVALVWGKKSKEAMDLYVDLRRNIMQSLEKENLKKNGVILKEQYDKIVQKAIESARKSGLLNAGVEKKLTQLYNLDWKEIKSAAEKSVKDVGSNFSKAVSKKAVKKPATAKKSPVKKATDKKVEKKSVASAAKKAATKKVVAKKKETVKKMKGIPSEK